MMSALNHTPCRAAPLALLLAALLTGCAVGPDYQRPATTLPASYTASSGEAAAAGEESIATDWWKHFGDATLTGLVEEALRNNADVRVAVGRMEQAEAAAREVGAAFLPEIDGQMGSTRNRVSTRTATPMPAGTPLLRDSRTAALTMSYEIDVWGRTRRSDEAARASALGSRYGRDAIGLTVAGAVTSQYLALRAYDAQLAVTTESLASQEESLKLVQLRVEAGLAAPLAQLQAESALAALQAQQAGLRQKRANTLHLLALLVGRPGLELAAGDLRQLPQPPVPPAGLPSSLVEGRPDVRQAEESLIAANAGIGMAKAGYFPKFTLTGSLGSESKTLTDLFTSGAGTWSAGLGLLVPILDFGRTSARVDQASAQQKQALASYQNTLQTAFKEVNDALVGLREQSATEAAQNLRADRSEQALKFAQARYEAGHLGYLDLQDTLRTRNDAQLQFIAARQARLTAAVDLFKALGGGWRPDTGKPAPAASPQTEAGKS